MKKFVSIVALVVFLVTLAGAACAGGGTGSAPACNAGAITVNATISMSNTGSITGTGKVTNLSGEDGWTFDMTIEVQKLQNGSWVMASRQKKTAKKIEISYQATKGATAPPWQRMRAGIAHGRVSSGGDLPSAGT